MSLPSWIEQQKLSVLRTGHGRNACGLQSFLPPIVFISVEGTFDDILQGLKKKKKKKCKSTRKGVVYWVSPSLFLNRNDW